MSGTNFTDRIDRRVVPRWRVSSEVALSGELTPLRERTNIVSFDRELARLKTEILLSPKPGVAADALGVAILSGDATLAAQAKDILHKHQDIVPEGLRKLIGTREEVIEDATEDAGCAMILGDAHAGRMWIHEPAADVVIVKKSKGGGELVLGAGNA